MSDRKEKAFAKGYKQGFTDGFSEGFSAGFDVAMEKALLMLSGLDEFDDLEYLDEGEEGPEAEM